MKRSRCRLICWCVLGSTVLLLAAALFALPWLVTAIDYPEVTVDLDSYFNSTNRQWFANRTLTAKVVVAGSLSAGYDVNCEGRLLDWDYKVALHADLGWLSAEGTARAELTGTPWQVKAAFQAESTEDWSVTVDLPETSFDERTAVLGDLLARVLPADFSSLLFTGRVSASAEARRTEDHPYPIWKVRGRIQNVGASLDTGDLRCALGNLRCSFGADGFADHVDLRPFFPRADFIEAGNVAVSNLFASVRATETAFLVTEAGADCAGGQIRAYSFFLNPERLDAGVTLFLDNIDAGEVMNRLAGFPGTASGRLQGRLPLRVQKGSQVRLGNAFLHSIPGETGKICVTETRPVLENLAAGGVPEAARENLGKALENLDYSVFRINLDREEGDAFALAVRLEGSASRGSTTVPVSFAVTFHGELENLLNLGIKTWQKGR